MTGQPGGAGGTDIDNGNAPVNFGAALSGFLRTIMEVKVDVVIASATSEVPSTAASCRPRR